MNIIKVYIDYDNHPDLGGIQVVREYNKDVPWNLRQQLPDMFLVGKTIVDVERVYEGMILSVLV